MPFLAEDPRKIRKACGPENKLWVVRRPETPWRADGWVSGCMLQWIMKTVQIVIFHFLHKIFWSLISLRISKCINNVLPNLCVKTRLVNV